MIYNANLKNILSTPKAKISVIVILLFFLCAFVGVYFYTKKTPTSNTVVQLNTKKPVPVDSKNATQIEVKETSNQQTKAKAKSHKVLVLGYHSVNEKIMGDTNTLSVLPSNFDKQMKFLKENSYTSISFEDLDNEEKLSTIKKPFIITFDDGFKDNFTYAYPILKKYNFKATVFMVVTFIGIPDYLDLSEINAMKDLVDIQSHTLSHRRLSQLNEAEIETELRDSQTQLQKITGKEVNALAYPCVDYNPTVEKIAKKYYKYINTTYTGLYDTLSDRFNITRIYIGRIHQMYSFGRRIQGLDLQ